MRGVLGGILAHRSQHALCQVRNDRKFAKPRKLLTRTIDLIVSLSMLVQLLHLGRACCRAGEEHGL